MGEGHEIEAALDLVAEAVVAGGDFVSQDEVRLHEVARG